MNKLKIKKQTDPSWLVKDETDGFINSYSPFLPEKILTLKQMNKVYNFLIKKYERQ
ncbi:MAG: hypothetical protein AABY22_36210 [Nanoarchaeota archaeon]